MYERKLQSIAVLCGAITATGLSARAQLADQPADMIERSLNAIGKITMVDADHQDVCSGTIFFVSRDGLAITNYHVVEGEFDGRVELPKHPDPLSFKILRLQPELDLALVRVMYPRIDQPFQLPDAPLVAAEPPRMGDRVWVMGHALGWAPSVSQGIVSAIRRCSDIDVCADNYDGQSTWIQTDCTINPGNSGGPMFDDAGSIIGVATWKLNLPGVDNAFFALSSTHIEQIMEAPLRVMSREQIAAVYTAHPVSQQMVPVPDARLNKTNNAKELRRALFGLINSASCRSCDGDGKVVEKVRTYKKLGNGKVMRDEKGVTVECSSCKGTGANEFGRYRQAMARFVDAFARFDLGSPGAEAITGFVENELVELGFECVGAFRDGMTPGAERILLEVESGSTVPILFHGRLIVDRSGVGGDRFRLVSLGDLGSQVVLRDPVVCSASQGADVIAGGLCIGTWVLSNGERVPVIQHGFIFPMTTPKRIR